MNEADVKDFWMGVVPRWQLGEIIFFFAQRKIADIIGDAPMHLDTIAEKAKLHRDPLRRVLNVLTAQGIFSRESGDRYANNAMSSPLHSGTPDSQRAYLEIGRVFMNEAWMDLPHAMETGDCPFDHRFGLNSFDYMKKHPEVEQTFAHAMSNSTKRVESALAAASFGDFNMVVDVGGSLGSLVRLLLANNPNAKGMVFDSPDVAAHAQRNWQGAPDAARLEAKGGSFFESVPVGGDLYLLKHILHDWKDADCVTIMKNVRAALKTGARVMVIEMILPEDSSPHPGWSLDMTMMMVTGGRERTLSEFTKLLAHAGLKVNRVIPTQSPVSMIEAVAA